MNWNQKYRRIIPCVLTAVLLLAFAVGCSKAPESGGISTRADLEGKVLGTVDSRVSGEQMMQTMKQYGGDTAEMTNFKEITGYRSTGDAISALKSGKVDAVFLPKMTADYYANRDDSIEILQDASSISYAMSVYMAVGGENASLRTQLDDALTELRESGALEALQEEWITGLTGDQQLEGEDLPVISGAPTYRVALSGDLVPLDYVAADGKAAGYCVEMLKALSDAMQVNFEAVQMDSSAKLMALESGKVDILFYIINSEKLASVAGDVEQENILLTQPYYQIDTSTFVVNK